MDTDAYCGHEGRAHQRWHYPSLSSYMWQKWSQEILVLSVEQSPLWWSVVLASITYYLVSDLSLSSLRSNHDHGTWHKAGVHFLGLSFSLCKKLQKEFIGKLEHKFVSPKSGLIHHTAVLEEGGLSVGICHVCSVNSFTYFVPREWHYSGGRGSWCGLVGFGLNICAKQAICSVPQNSPHPPTAHRE